MPETRIIKRYANRKLYDTEHSRYVTLDQISEMIRNGDDVKIVDNKTKEDLTTVTLAQIIFEEEKKQRSFLPLNAMRNIIQSGGEWFAEAQRRVQNILPGKKKDGEDGVEDEVPEVYADEAASEAAAKKKNLAALREWVDHSKHRLEDWQKQVDSKVRGVVEDIQHAINPWAGVNKDVKHLADRIAELEAKLHELEVHENKDAAAAAEARNAAASANNDPSHNS
jgi:polyhydroxyalkanoate synthesis repressor PhaR